MPLSEHEQRLLEQIEAALYAEDPKFASTVRSINLRKHRRRGLVRAAVLFVAGLGLLLAGVITKVIWMGVAGFVVMLAALLLGVSFWQRRTGRPAQGTDRRSSDRRRVSVLARLEERWRRREERGF